MEALLNGGFKLRLRLWCPPYGRVLYIISPVKMFELTFKVSIMIRVLGCGYTFRLRGYGADYRRNRGKGWY